jgi:hypothetical protein
MAPPTEQLVRDYLNRVSMAARRRLPAGDRRALLARIRSLIEDECGPLDAADYVQVQRALSGLGDPASLVHLERQALLHHRSLRPGPRGADAGGLLPSASSRAASRFTGELSAPRSRPITARLRPGEPLREHHGGPPQAAEDAAADPGRAARGSPADPGQAAKAAPGDPGQAARGNLADPRSPAEGERPQLSDAGQSTDSGPRQSTGRGRQPSHPAPRQSAETAAGQSAETAAGQPADTGPRQPRDAAPRQSRPAGPRETRPARQPGHTSRWRIRQSGLRSADIAQPASYEANGTAPAGAGMGNESRAAGADAGTGSATGTAFAGIGDESVTSGTRNADASTVAGFAGAVPAGGAGNAPATAGTRAADVPTAAGAPVARPVGGASAPESGDPTPAAGKAPQQQRRGTLLATGARIVGRGTADIRRRAGGLTAVGLRPRAARTGAQGKPQTPDPWPSDDDLKRQATRFGRRADVVGRRATILARRHPLEAAAVIMLAVGGLICPFPSAWLPGLVLWLVGTVLALLSALWDVKDRWIGLAGPVALIVVGTVVLVALGGKHVTGGAYVHEALTDGSFLIRIGAVLGAGYLAWRLHRGRRAPAIPPWHRRTRR